MLLIDNDIVYLTKGDDAEIEVNIRDGDGNDYEMQDGDTLTLTVRELPDFSSNVVFAITSTTNRIPISHADTDNADVGRYSMDIELITSGLHRTIFPTLEKDARARVKNFRNFVIMPEVTV